MNTATNHSEMGLTGHEIPVHKAEHEGVLLIDGFTGQVIPNQHDRPEWAEGLVIAQLTERHNWYTQRMGAEAYAASGLNAPEALAFEDLGWLGLETTATNNADEDGAEIVLEADDEFRMEILAGLMGADRDTGEIVGTHHEQYIAQDNTRTEAEMKDFREAQEQQFQAVNG